MPMAYKHIYSTAFKRLLRTPPALRPNQWRQRLRITVVAVSAHSCRDDTARLLAQVSAGGNTIVQAAQSPAPPESSAQATGALSPALTYQCFGQSWLSYNPQRLVLTLCDFDCCSDIDQDASPKGTGTVVSLSLEWTDPEGNSGSRPLTPGTYRIFAAADSNPRGQFAVGYYGTAVDWSKQSDERKAMKFVIEGSVTIDSLSFPESSDKAVGGSLTGSCELYAPDHPKVDGHHVLHPTFEGELQWVKPSDD